MPIEIILDNARAALKDSSEVSGAFIWSDTKQGHKFWEAEAKGLTHLGRTILRKWIAEAEATTASSTTKQVA